MYTAFCDDFGLEPEDYSESGPYLGQSEKFLLLLCERKSEFGRYLAAYLNAEHDSSYRFGWFGECMFLGANIEAIRESFASQAGEPYDTMLHCKVVASLAANFVDGFRASLNPAPVWLSYGLGHVYQRRIDPRRDIVGLRSFLDQPANDAPFGILVTQGEAADKAKAAGADFVGMEELAEQIKGGMMDFDVVIAAPDAMRVVGALGTILGPRGLMPNPKTGTVTMNVAKAVGDIKGGKIEFRIDKHSNLQFPIGKSSFTPEQLVENYGAALDEILRLKPSSSKGRYIKKATVSSTMGPGVQIDPSRTRSLLTEEE